MECKKPIFKTQSICLIFVCVVSGIIIGCISLMGYWKLHLLENELTKVKLEAQEAKSLSNSLRSRIELVEKKVMEDEYIKAGIRGE